MTPALLEKPKLQLRQRDTFRRTPAHDRVAVAQTVQEQAHEVLHRAGDGFIRILDKKKDPEKNGGNGDVSLNKFIS